MKNVINFVKNNAQVVAAGGAILSLVGGLATSYANERELEEKIAKEVAKQMHKSRH